MTASPRTIRVINDRLALELLTSEGPLTATQLRARTGLSRPSVSDLVERLQAAGLVAVVGESGADRRGPNARLYGIVADHAHLAAFDVRTGGVALEIADLLGRPVAGATLPVELGDDPDATAREAVALLRRTAREAGAAVPHTIAVGAPGLVDPVTGVLRNTDEPSGWHVVLVEALRREFGVPVLLENEVNLAAVAEHRLGAVRDRDTFALIWLGQSVGAGVVLEGRLRRGASGGTGEIGFLPLPGTPGLPSATGCDGGFHALVGAAAVRDLADEHGITAQSAEAAVALAAAEPGDGGQGDGGQGGGAFLDALAARVALGAAAVCAVLDPGCLVLAGEVGRAGGPALAARVAGRLAALSPLRTEVRAATVEGSAVLRGAVLVAMDAAQDALFTPRT